MAFKNTVETDQESSLIQLIGKYVHKTGDKRFVFEKVDQKRIIDRMADMVNYLLKERYSSHYGLIYGAMTADWGDVQPNDDFGCDMNELSVKAIDVYDNAMALRIYPEDELCDVLMILAAANIARTPVTLSITREDPKLEALQKGINKECTIKIQSDDDFLNDIEQYERIRTCSSRLPYELYKQAARLGKYIATAKPLVEGRVELLHYLKEQSVAFEYHRYGSITDAIE